MIDNKHANEGITTNHFHYLHYLEIENGGSKRDKDMAKIFLTAHKGI